MVDCFKVHVETQRQQKSYLVCCPFETFEHLRNLVAMLRSPGSLVGMHQLSSHRQCKASKWRRFNQSQFLKVLDRFIRT